MAAKKRETVLQRQKRAADLRRLRAERHCVRGCGAVVGQDGPLPTGWRVLAARKVICDGCDRS